MYYKHTFVITLLILVTLNFALPTYGTIYCNKCLKKCCKDFKEGEHEEYKYCIDNCKSGDCEDADESYYENYTCPKLCINCLEECCHFEEHDFKECSNNCKLEDCKGLDKLYGDYKCKVVPPTTIQSTPSTSTGVTTTSTVTSPTDATP